MDPSWLMAILPTSFLWHRKNEWWTIHRYYRGYWTFRNRRKHAGFWEGAVKGIRVAKSCECPTRRFGWIHNWDALDAFLNIESQILWDTVYVRNRAVVMLLWCQEQKIKTSHLSHPPPEKIRAVLHQEGENQNVIPSEVLNTLKITADWWYKNS